jgi:hypothetical protein
MRNPVSGRNPWVSLFFFILEKPPPYVAFVIFRNPMEPAQECATVRKNLYPSNPNTNPNYNPQP